MNYTKEDLIKYYNMPLEELLSISKKLVGDEIEFCSLISARTGKCSQDCKYCSQSSHYNTNIETSPFVSLEEVTNTALHSKDNHATRFAIVTSGKTPEEDDFDTILKMIKTINKIDGIKSCASIGILNEEEAKKLKEAGLVRFHHNINTCKSYYPEICTTHTYEDRINTTKLVKKYGMELCCGVIIGMGETVEQRIEMALELAEIKPESIPVNVLMPIKGTPFEHYENKIDEENIMRTLAVFKIANPNAILRFAGGRATRLSKENIEKAAETSVESMIIGNMLTTIGIEPEEDMKMVHKLNKKIKK